MKSKQYDELCIELTLDYTDTFLLIKAWEAVRDFDIERMINIRDYYIEFKQKPGDLEIVTALHDMVRHLKITCPPNNKDV